MFFLSKTRKKGVVMFILIKNSVPKSHLAIIMSIWRSFNPPPTSSLHPSDLNATKVQLPITNPEPMSITRITNIIKINPRLKLIENPPEELFGRSLSEDETLPTVADTDVDSGERTRTKLHYYFNHIGPSFESQ